MVTGARAAPAPGVDPDANAAAIHAESVWFRAVLDLRLRVHSGERPPCDPLVAVPPPPRPPPARRTPTWCAGWSWTRPSGCC